MKVSSRLFDVPHFHDERLFISAIAIHLGKLQLFDYVQFNENPIASRVGAYLERKLFDLVSRLFFSRSRFELGFDFASQVDKAAVKIILERVHLIILVSRNRNWGKA